MNDTTQRAEWRIHVKPYMHAFVKQLTKMDRHDIQRIMEYAEGLTQGTQVPAVGVDASALTDVNDRLRMLELRNSQVSTRFDQITSLINVALAASGGVSYDDVYGSGQGETAKSLNNWLSGQSFTNYDLPIVDEAKPSEGKFVWDKQD